jgi:glycosyltransferase involved in cell wall biosynthesis
MRLLIVTQVVDKNDPVLGFFHRWIEEFAKHTERVTVICLREGVHSLPQNVSVYSLGKERKSRSRFGYAYSELRLICALRNEYDSVFVHMNPEHLIVSGLFWRIMGKRVSLWYLHKAVSWRLRVGVLFAERVFTASKDSFRIRTNKVRIVGHGIDTELFSPGASPAGFPVCITVGRVARIKKVDVLIRAFARSAAFSAGSVFKIIGPFESEAYRIELESLIAELGAGDQVRFMGPLSQERTHAELAASRLFLHASDTGSIDKAPLEALSTGIPVITANRELGQIPSPAVIKADPSPESFTEKINEAIEAKTWNDSVARTSAREVVLTTYALPALISRVLAELASIRQG